MTEGKSGADGPSFQLCPPVTRPEDRIASGGSESGEGYKIELRGAALPPDWPLKQAEARRLWARFIVRSAQAAAMRERLKETA
jgi:hypothetical protein